MDSRTEQAIYEAFLAAAKSLGPQVKGLSCFVRNWGAHAPAAEKKAA